MRSNTQNTNSNPAVETAEVKTTEAKTITVEMMKEMIGKLLSGSRKALGLLTLGITTKQWLAMIMISTMLLSSVFALPVRAALLINDSTAVGNNDPVKLGLVDGPLPIWKQMWMDMNSKTEDLLTSLRAVNNNFAGVNTKDDDNDMGGKDKTKPDTKADNISPKESLERRVKTLDIQIEKNKKIQIGQTLSLVAVSKDDKGKVVDGITPTWTSSNPDIIKISNDSNAIALKSGKAVLKAGIGIAEKEITVKVEASAVKNVSSTLNLKTKSMAVDISPEQPERPILVDSELKELVSPENNLGTPVGQTEAKSNTPAAALPVIDRAGIGNFSFGLPVASLPGRGISASVGISYNSQLWTKSGVEPNSHFTYNIDGNWLAPGFQIGYGYLDDYNAYGQLPYQLILTDTSGTRHRMTKTTSINGHASYDSNDGSFMRGDAIYNSNNIVTDLTVTYTDGTKVTYGQPNIQSRRFPVKITDINGNFITINYLTDDQVGKISSIRDTLGRDIVFHYDTTTEQNLISVTVPGYDNSAIPRQTIRFYYQSLTLSTTGRFDGTINAPPSQTVLKYVYFPGTKTGFRYDYSANFGMIYKIIQLQGMQVSTTDPDQAGTVTETPGSYLESATTQYNYPGTGSTSLGSALDDIPKYNTRTDDWIGRDQSAPAPTTTYIPSKDIDATTGIGTRTMSVTSPNGTTNISVSTVNPGVWDDGLIKEISVTSPDRTLPWSKTIITWDPEATSSTGRRNPQVRKIVSINEVGQAKAATFAYDDYNNPTVVREFDFSANGEETTELRRTETTYEASGNYTYNRLVHLPTSVKTIVDNVVVSRIDYKYDENALTDRANIIQYDPAYNPNITTTYPCNCHYECDTYVNGDSGRCAVPPTRVCDSCPTYNSNHNYRGNVTTIKSFVDTGNNNDPNASVTAFSYDIAGNKTAATLNCCNLKAWTYDSTNNTYAYQISQTKGTDTQLTTSTTYDFNTGLVKTSTDENNQVTNYEYEPDTLRMKKVTYPNGGYIQTEYSDKLITTQSQLSPGFVITTTTIDTNKTAQSYSYYDGRGAEIRSADQTPDGWSISAMEYDPIGRPKKTFNPFYGVTSTDPVPGSVKWAEVTNYDALDRTTEVKLQDDTFVNSYYNEAAVSFTAPGNLTRFGTATRVKDQAGEERRQIVDALDRIIRVDEPNTTSNTLGSVASPNLPTHYFYDGNDNLSKVIQSDGNTIQERRFKYDALSRLTHEKQVEATPTLDDAGVAGAYDPNKWTKVLKYDVHGLITDGIDARGVNTHFSYDTLNRVQAVAYSDSTSAVTYTYDQVRTGFFNKGALTRVETAAGDVNLRPDTTATASEFDYDQMGRLRKHRQSIGSQNYNLEYNYNLAGQLTSEIYPSGKAVSTNYDTNGRLSSISDQSRTYTSGIQYQKNGGMLSGVTLGNGIQESFDYNDRLQSKQIAWTKNNQIVQRYDYTYGQINTQTNTVDTTKNNGQLVQVESYIGGSMSVPTRQATQQFSYDSVGRLKTETEFRGDNGSQSYKQTFSYDNFGNRYLKAAENPVAQNPLLPTPVEDNQIDKATNRFSPSTGTVYDNAGNVTTDGKFRGQKYYYDANGRMYRTSNTDDTNQATSVYDAGGQRVATQANGLWKFMVYDASGKMIAEYGGLQSTGEGGIKYVLQDNQGSARTITSISGAVQARMDYTAFGEQIQSNIGQRTSQGYTSSNDFRQKYALTERDEATGLDHTWFRKNENRAGRWTSPDPYNGSASIGDPQSFNRYSYVENQPTNFIDPSGLDGISETVNVYAEYDTLDLSGLWDLLMGGGGYAIAIKPVIDPGPIGGDPTLVVPPPPPPDDDTCGYNPITATPGFNRTPKGVPGNLRPGVRGGGEYGARRNNAGRQYTHTGVDISAISGVSDAYAFYAGVVKSITGSSQSTQGYGLTITVDHGNGYTSQYSHLSSVTNGLRVGSRVGNTNGTAVVVSTVGVAGQSGNASGQPASEAHVHFEIRKNGKILNPEDFLNSPCPEDFHGR